MICPGLVLTEAVKQHLTDEYVERGLKAIPHTRLGQPEDIANAALFLASDESMTITGQSINCDAGAYMVG